MSNKRLILIGGGARSGKSNFALSLALKLGARRLFLATAEAGDEEMADRIRRHRQERGNNFITLEEPVDVPERIRQAAAFDVLVLDCLTLWISNMLLRQENDEQILRRIDSLLAVLAEGSAHAIIVTNEVGMGVVPETALGRAFRDVTGLVHQRLGQAADEIYFAVLGTMIRIKPNLEFVQV